MAPIIYRPPTNLGSLLNFCNITVKRHRITHPQLGGRSKLALIYLMFLGLFDQALRVQFRVKMSQDSGLDESEEVEVQAKECGWFIIIQCRCSSTSVTILRVRDN